MRDDTWTIPYKMPGLNEYINAINRSKYVGNDMKQEWTTISALHACKLKKFTNPVSIDFTWCEDNGRRDPDNIIFAKKMILDGLVKAGILANDTQKDIVAFTDTWKVDPPARVIVRIREV